MKKIKVVLGVACLLFLIAGRTDHVRSAGFHEAEKGAFQELKTKHGTWKTEAGVANVVVHPGDAQRVGIHLYGKSEGSLVLTLPEAVALRGLSVNVERWTGQPPFKFFIDIRGVNVSSPWKQVFSLADNTSTGRKPAYEIEFEKTTVAAIRFRCNALENYGALLTDLTLKEDRPMEFVGFVPEETYPPVVPILLRDADNPISQTVFVTEGYSEPLSIDRLAVTVRGSEQLASLSLVRDGKNLLQWMPTEGENVFSFKIPAISGRNEIRLCATAKETATVGAEVTAFISELVVDGREFKHESNPESSSRRIGRYLVKPNENGIHFYRIPGLVRTNTGTLVAVYDLRHTSGGDLPNDIDVGMSRSTDGGQTWEPTRTIMDFGDHDPKEGVGDPAILVDRQTGRIWVGAAWAHKGISSFNSAPGAKPGTSAQFVVCHSDDDGLTWSQPVSVSEQVAANSGMSDLKMFFDGPGAGITTRDGTLVFPAQYMVGKETIPNLGGGNYQKFVSECHATILWSRDQGKTWTLSPGARSLTTEAQVVELNDGSLMLTARDERKTGTRAVFVTHDLGKTWQEHSTSNKALQDPVCQASILRVASTKDGDERDLIAFFNVPKSSWPRTDLTVFLSEDEGTTWPRRKLIYAPANWGYSCMCMVDPETIGVLYETIGGLIFEKIGVETILRPDDNASKK